MTRYIVETFHPHYNDWRRFSLYPVRLGDAVRQQETLEYLFGVPARVVFYAITHS